MNHTGVVNHEVTGLLEVYFRDCRADGQSRETVRVRRSYLHRWAATIPPDAPPSRDHIRAFLAWQRWSPNTRRSAGAAIRSFLRWAHREGHDGLPSADVVILARAPKGLPRPAAAEAIRAALAAAEPRVQLMIRLAAGCGLRRAEVAAVHTRDWRPGVLVVTGKGGKTREVPVPATLDEQLAAAPVGYLFPGSCDGHLSADRVGRLVAAALPGNLTAHTLRHRFATTVYEREHDLLALADMLGHESIETTRIYTKVGARALAAAAAATDI